MTEQETRRPYRLSPHFQLARVGLHLLYGALQIALLFPLLAQARRDKLKQEWSRQLLLLLRVAIAPLSESERAELATIGHGLLVSNHISFIDIFVINAVMPSGFVSKDDVASWPLIGWLSRKNGTVFIQRGSSRAAHRTRTQMNDALCAGQRLAIFPEGTTSTGDRVLPFHGALLQSAIDAAVPVHALRLSYSDTTGQHSNAPAYIGDISVIDCLIATLRSGGVTARLRLVSSFQPPHTDRRQLAHQAHQAIAGGLAVETQHRLNTEN